MIQDTTVGCYIFTDNNNYYALENHSEMSEDFAAKLFADQGWVLWDQTKEKLIAVIPGEDGCQLQDMVGKTIF